MSLVDWKTPLAANEVPGTRSGNLSGVEGAESVTWLMQTNSAFETMFTLEAYGVLPAYLSPHPQATYATRREITYKPAVATNAGVGAYHVTAKYSSAALSQTERDKQVLDPRDRPARIVVKSRKVMEAYDKDISGNPVVNAASDYFDPPPERPVTRYVFSVSKNVAVVPLWFLEYEEAVNNASFSIKGVTVGTGCAKLSDIAISDDMVENGFDFLQLSFEIEVRKAPSGGTFKDGSSSTRPRPSYTPNGWTTVLLNQGLYQFDADDKLVRCTDENEANAVSPKLLDASGTQIANPAPADAVFLCWENHALKDFSVLPLT